jgi:hypothetical protein
VSVKQAVSPVRRASRRGWAAAENERKIEEEGEDEGGAMEAAAEVQETQIRRRIPTSSYVYVYTLRSFDLIRAYTAGAPGYGIHTVHTVWIARLDTSTYVRFDNTEPHKCLRSRSDRTYIEVWFVHSVYDLCTCIDTTCVYGRSTRIRYTYGTYGLDRSTRYVHIRTLRQHGAAQMSALSIRSNVHRGLIRTFGLRSLYMYRYMASAKWCGLYVDRILRIHPP